MRLRFTSAAERELADALDYYEKVEKGLGGKFLVEVESATEQMVDPHTNLP